MDPNGSVLDISDIASPTWIKLRRHIDQKIAALDRANRSPMDEAKTAHLRGKIAALLALVSDAEGIRPGQMPGEDV